VVLAVSIPSSSGIVFRRAASSSSWARCDPRLNPFFVRDRLPTTKSSLRVCVLQLSRLNPFFVRDRLPTTPVPMTLEVRFRARSQSLLRQGSSSDHSRTVCGPSSSSRRLNPFFVRDRLPTGKGSGPPDPPGEHQPVSIPSSSGIVFRRSSSLRNDPIFRVISLNPFFVRDRLPTRHPIRSGCYPWTNTVSIPSSSGIVFRRESWISGSESSMRPSGLNPFFVRDRLPTYPPPCVG